MRTELAAQMFTETFGRPPAGARELSGHLARISRQATTAVARLRPVLLPRSRACPRCGAVAPREVAQAIEQAHHDAVKDTVTWLENNADLHPPRQERRRPGRRPRGLIAAAFTHRDSRAGDPDLHTHVAISNKVQALDGKWLALDGRAHLQVRRRRLRAVQHPPRSTADRPARGAVRRPSQARTRPSGRSARSSASTARCPRHWSSRRAEIDVRSERCWPRHSRPTTADPRPRKRRSRWPGQANKETPPSQARTPLLRRTARYLAHRSGGGVRR